MRANDGRYALKTAFTAANRPNTAGPTYPRLDPFLLFPLHPFALSTGWKL